MQNLFFSGHNLSRKGKNSTQQQYKNKKIKASHFAVETVGRSMEVGTAGLRGRGQRALQTPGRVVPGKNHTRKRAGCDPNCSQWSKTKKGSGVFCS